MTKNLIKLAIALVLFAALLSPSFNAKAFPAYLKQAVKFGAKDCLFCHQKPEGGEGWNERGQWLIAEKERRKAEAVEVEWLADYKESEKKEADQDDKKEEHQKKDEPKKPKDKDKPKDP